MKEHLETLLVIGLGGFIGANVRYVVGNWAVERFGKGFPYGTLIINFTGSALLGVFIAWLANHSNADPRLRLLIAVGFFGAYTTFSTYANETIALVQAGDWMGAIGNVLVSNVLCIAGAAVGLAVGNRLG